jgi:hypothetical protein
VDLTVLPDQDSHLRLSSTPHRLRFVRRIGLFERFFPVPPDLGLYFGHFGSPFSLRHGGPNAPVRFNCLPYPFV